MVTRTATVRNLYGIHVRPSAVIVKQAREYSGTIAVTSDKRTTIDAKNLLGIISLGLTADQAVTIAVSGPEEEKWAETMVELFECNFDFKR